MNAFIDTARKEASRVLRLNATPRGFLAAKGGYDSLWARDGAISILGALRTRDAKLLACSRAHLRTLKRYQRADGLVPNHVNVKTKRIWYGGNIGRISAVDANLWYAIAALEYASSARDRAFLREFKPSILKALTYTRHLDSNNDDLLEVPEASDWADLLPRSGNILTEDVLHYHALDRAGQILNQSAFRRRAGIVRRAIRGRYWMTDLDATRRRPEKWYGTPVEEFFSRTPPFLLSHLTAFGFSWRVDPWGNVLAALFGVLTKSEARRLVKYLFGIGVSDPFPAKALYPVMYPGDPEWRDYMPAGLHNFPHQYHNGGIWPFIGGFWVTLLWEIGEHGKARTELEKLAEANRRGLENEWEFNEWLHGVTGKPMGKKNQAWSAAAYILAHAEVTGS